MYLFLLKIASQEMSVLDRQVEARPLLGVFAISIYVKAKSMILSGA